MAAVPPNPPTTATPTNLFIDRQQTDATRVSTLSSLRHAQSIAALQLVHGEQSAPISMEWEDVKFSVGGKEILKGCTGVIQPGVLTGVMGPSGSGKTTMLNVLSGRQRLRGRDRSSGQPVEFSGQLYACGSPVKPNYFLGKVAYVFQDHAIPMSETPYECFMFSARFTSEAELFLGKVAYVFQDHAIPMSETPYECFLFSASLRLPREVSAEERKEYVEAMLKLLNLWNSKDNHVGSTTRKGLSGGEQKRVAVGVELISNPQLLFLDEPLSGLDSYNAMTLMETMKRLSESDVPVMMTVHQPSSEVFDMFTDIIIMHAGEVCYHGPASAMVAYFEQMGHKCPSFHNPSDFVMSRIQRAKQEVLENIKSSWKASAAYDRLRGRFDAYLNSALESEDSEADDASRMKVPDNVRGCFGGLSMLMAREWRWVKYERKNFIMQQICTYLVALTYGQFFHGKGGADRHPAEAQNCENSSFHKTSCQALFNAHLAVLSMVGISVMLSSQAAVIQLMQRDRACFLRERAGGYYSALPYFLMKQLTEVICAMLNSLIVLVGLYWLVGLQANFCVLFMELTLMSLSSASILLMVAAGASSMETVAAVSIIPQVMQFAFSGLLLPVSLIPTSIQWVKWICPLYHGLNMISLSEFGYVYKEEALCKSNHGERWRESCPGTAASLDILEVADVHQGDFWWPSMGSCVLLAVGLRFLGYLVMVRKSRYAV
eukprot:CAMPEP_0195152998 /NCGR_PEP_ID=MMETSP0448-20130528/182927_1 /TAXON_ID=66468 /ORGANISM="Heterocapsa triquestra, Strain CCMP 448" /LENGTH=715 /DNA_ID=CAMNT_0040191763 /DNA_START=73 /DNA_END=2221 /DNA_ORIENTATION=+